MTREKSYITLEDREKETLQKALNNEFGENRITLGCYVRILASDRLSEL